jgi:predicted transcriptional regulator
VPLENKGHLTHEREGGRYVYRPTTDPKDARRSALDHLLETFYDGSAAAVVSALLEERRGEISEPELERLSRLIRQARKEGR